MCNATITFSANFNINDKSWFNKNCFPLTNALFGIKRYTREVFILIC